MDKSNPVPHPIRLLTVFKGVQGTNEQLICLSIHLDPVSRNLIVSSKERLLPNGIERPEPDSLNLSGSCFILNLLFRGFETAFQGRFGRSTGSDW